MLRPNGRFVQCVVVATKLQQRNANLQLLPLVRPLQPLQSSVGQNPNKWAATICLASQPASREKQREIHLCISAMSSFQNEGCLFSTLQHRARGSIGDCLQWPIADHCRPMKTIADHWPPVCAQGPAEGVKSREAMKWLASRLL